MYTEILNEVDTYYSKRIEKYGATIQGTDWNSKETQKIRFEQLTKILNPGGGKGASVCDYGCAYGDYYEYLKENGYDVNYTGIDISEKMIEAALKKYGLQENIKFIHGSQIDQPYDFIVASGVFNVRQNASNEKWTNYMIDTMEKFQKYSKKGFAFNALTKYSDPERMRDDLYYADPLFYFDYAKRHFSRNVCLLHDYEIYDFTLLVRK